MCIVYWTYYLHPHTSSDECAGDVVNYGSGEKVVDEANDNTFRCSECVWMVPEPVEEG